MHASAFALRGKSDRRGYVPKYLGWVGGVDGGSVAGRPPHAFLKVGRTKACIRNCQECFLTRLRKSRLEECVRAIATRTHRNSETGRAAWGLLIMPADEGGGACIVQS